MASNLEPKINRIATAVTSALSALTAKGVTVPAGANVESLAALIESIEAGGGGGFACGKFTPTSNISLGPDANFKIETGFIHKNGSVNFVMLTLSGSSVTGQYNTHIIANQSGWGQAIAYKTVSGTMAKYDTLYYDSNSYFSYDYTTGVVTLNGKISSQVINAYYGNADVVWAIWV